MSKTPEMRITKIRAVLMLFVAAIFSIIIFVFATFPISAPVILAEATNIIVTNKTGSETIGRVVGAATGSAFGIAELVTGVGVTAVATFGEITADVLEFFALILIFPIWYLLYGVKQFGSTKAMKRLFITATGLIIGLIPFLNILPTVLISVSLIIFSVRKEDAEEIKKYKESNKIQAPKLKPKRA